MLETAIRRAARDRIFRLLFCALTVCATVADAQDRNSEVKRVRDQTQRWAAAWSHKDVKGIMQLYAPQAVFFAGGDRFSGAPAIEALFTTTLRSVTPGITMQSIETEVSNTLAYDSGTYTETIASSAETRHLRGNYLIVFAREGGHTWRVIQQMWTEMPSDNATRAQANRSRP